MKAVNDVNTSFVSGIGWMGVSKAVTQIGTWSATIIIARLLMPADYGLVGMSGLLVGVITLVGDFGLNASIIQQKNVSKRELSTLFWQFVLFGIFLSSLIYFLAPIGCAFWSEPELLNLIRLSATTFFFTSLSQIPSALLQKKMRFREYGIVLSCAALCGSIVSIVLAYYEMGPYSLILGTLTVVIVKLILLFLYEPFVPQFVFSIGQTLSHLKFGATITIERYLWWYYSNCDFWLASKFLGKNAYGNYSMAFQLASLPIEKITSIINPVALPAFSKIDNSSEREAFFLIILKYMAYISFPIFIGFFWTADDFINIVLGKKWQESIIPFRALVLVFPLRCLASLNSPLLISMRRADVGVKNMVFGAIFASIAFAVGVQHGITGLAYSWVIFYPIFYLVCLYNVGRVANISIVSYFFNLKYIISNILCMSVAIYLFQLLFYIYLGDSCDIISGGITRFCGTILVGAISFFLFALYFDRATMSNLIGFIRKKKVGI